MRQVPFAAMRRVLDGGLHVTRGPQGSDEASESSRGARLRELAGLFLKLGTVSFGGPAVHVAMMEAEVVRRRRWISRETFLDLVGATNLIPGPNSTELAIHIGHLRAGWPGLLVAGACFILPAALLVCAIAWMYTRFGMLPRAEGFLYGVKPVVIAVVVQALWGLSRTALRSRFLVGLGATALLANLAGVHELIVLLMAALAALSHQGWRLRSIAPGATLSLPLGPALAALALGPAVASPLAKGLWPIFFFFLKVGSVLFGSGYVLLAFLRADLVERYGWLTEGQLFDAIAVGQITPGPVFTTATFIGYVLGGPGAAIAATLGIFLPAFFFVAVSAPLLPRLRRSRWTSALLDGVNTGSLALMAAVTLQMVRSAVVDLPSGAIAALSAAMLIWTRVNAAWLVLGGGALGAVLHSVE